MTERLAARTVVDDRYEVLHRLGSGGMAEVYCAQDTQLGRKIALKILYRRLAEDDEFVERFRREASSAAGLQHPNVVSVYDRGTWDGTYYIAMEYLHGRTLKEIVQDEGPLDPADACDLILQVLKAARFAHRHGVIHRDFKPHNVIVDAEGRAKVTDFGIARAGKSEMTQTGSIMGTAQYLSPEQAQGHGVTAQSDLYSIGVMLYELLAGRVPFDAESAVTIALKHVSERPVPPSVYNPAVAPGLEAVVMRALEKDPARRFAGADEFIAALQDAQRALPAKPTTRAVAVPPAPTEEVTALAAAAPSPWLTQSYAPPPGWGGWSDAAPPPAEGRRNRWWLALPALLLVIGLIVAAALVLVGPKVTVPKVVGVPQAAAETRLHHDGFNVQTATQTSGQPRGRVIGQDPPAFSRVRKGSTVTLTISDGPGQATVPHVDGMGRIAAYRQLRHAGFKVDEVQQSSDTVTKNHVIATSPGNDQVIDKGATVTMYVSSGPQQIEVPDVRGQSFDDATATLDDAGFKWRRVEQPSDQPPGTVLSQDPIGGTPKPKGSRVTLYVAKESQTVAVPDVVGKTEDEAISTLFAAGLASKPVYQPVTDPNQDGKVIAQKPPAGKKVKRGSRVEFTVGQYTAPAQPPAQPPAPPPSGTGGVLPGPNSGVLPQ